MNEPEAITTWRCFHCDEVFTNRTRAAEHFGDTLEQEVACRLASGDYHLTRYIREMERELRKYRVEDSHVLRAYDSLKADFYQKIRESEERGYSKGVSQTVAMYEKGLSPLTEGKESKS